MSVPFDRQLWSAQECADYLKQSKYEFLRRTRFRNDFPSELENVRLRWHAASVVAWKPSTNPPKTSLYRHFDESGQLLYVGIALSANRRMGAHRRNSRWFDRVATIRVEHFATRKQAMDAERKAIKTEKPLFNVSLNRD